MMTLAKQSTGIVHPAVRYEYTYRYDFQPEKAKAKTTTALQPEKSPGSNKSPLDLLSSAASAMVDDEESASVVSSSSSQPQGPQQGIRSSSSTLSSSSSSPPPPQALQTHALHVRYPPIAYAKVRQSPPTAFVVSPGPSPTLPPKLPPSAAAAAAAAAPLSQKCSLPVFPQNYAPYGRSLPTMRQAMHIGLGSRKQTQTTFIATTSAVGSICNNKVASSKASAFVPKAAPCKRQKAAKYEMKYHCVSMKRSEAMKYIEAVSKSTANSQQYYVDNHHHHHHHHHHRKNPILPVVSSWNQSPVLGPRSLRFPPRVQQFRPVAVSMPASAQVYSLPMGKAAPVVPPSF